MKEENQKLELSPGPRLELTREKFTIVDRGFPRVEGKRESDIRHVLTLVAYYYLMNLTYPQTYGSVMGLLQEFVIQHDFVEKSVSYRREAAKFCR